MQTPRLSAILWPFDLRVNACLGPAISLLMTMVLIAQGSSHFLFRAQTYIHKQTHLRALPTPEDIPAWVMTDNKKYKYLKTHSAYTYWLPVRFGNANINVETLEKMFLKRPKATQTWKIKKTFKTWQKRSYPDVKHGIALGAARRYALADVSSIQKSRRIYVRPRTGPQSAHLRCPVYSLGSCAVGQSDGRTDGRIALFQNAPYGPTAGDTIT